MERKGTEMQLSVCLGSSVLLAVEFQREALSSHRFGNFLEIPTVPASQNPYTFYGHFAESSSNRSLIILPSIYFILLRTKLHQSNLYSVRASFSRSNCASSWIIPRQ